MTRRLLAEAKRHLWSTVNLSREDIEALLAYVPDDVGRE